MTPTFPRITTPFFALLVLVSCQAAGPKGRGGHAMPPTPVEVADVNPRIVRDRFHALGTLEADQNIEVVSEVGGKVRSIAFAEGQRVVEGATLVQIEDAEYRAEAKRSEAQRALAVADFERAKTLHEQNVISNQELDDKKAALQIAEANEELAKARLAKTRIVAPWSGLIGRRRVSTGSYVSAGDRITDMARVDEIRVEFSAPERFFDDLKSGIEVNVSTPAFPGEVFRGKVTVVDPIVDPTTRNVQLVARIPNTDRRLRPGMSANVDVTLQQRSDALVVPDEALFADGTQTFVYVVKPDSTVSKTAVRTGTRDSAVVEVVEGLEPGSLVVSAGHQKLYEGAKVMPVQSLEAMAQMFGGAPAAGGAEKGTAEAAEANADSAKGTEKNGK
jgi:membrane fusion protein (multidrug efflux system)